VTTFYPVTVAVGHADKRPPAETFQTNGAGPAIIKLAILVIKEFAAGIKLFNAVLSFALWLMQGETIIG
jgi:hypothetical protein